MLWNLLPWILVFFAVLTPALALAEWLIGDEGVTKAKSRLADWYVYVEDGDWSMLISSSARQTEAFLRQLLGEKLISFRGVLIWFAVSGTLSLTAFTVNQTVKNYGVANTVGGILGVFVIDFVFLILGRVLLRRLGSTSHPRAAFGFLAYSVIASYLGIGLFFGAGNDLTIDAEWHPHMAGGIQDWIRATLTWPLTFYYFVFQAPQDGRGGYSGAGAVLMLLPATLSSILFGSVVTSAWLLYSTEKWSRSMVALLIERVASLKGAVLTAISTAVTTLIAVTTAVEHAHRSS